MQNRSININELSTSELEKLLADKKKAEKQRRMAEKAIYEKDKDGTIELLWDEANELALATARFKNKLHTVMDLQAEKLNQYGGIRGNSKGGFAIVHSNGSKNITRRRDTDRFWDERATKAVGLIKDFLSDTVKKRDAQLHDILMSFLERNVKGDLEYAKVMDLLKHEDKFNDLRWVSGLQLIKESYSQSFKAFGYEFKKRNQSGKWESLSLNFSSL